MRLLLLLSWLVAVQSGVLGGCDGPIINGVIHTDEILKSDMDSISDLSYDSATNTLYFTYVFASRYVSKIDLNTKASENLQRVYGVHSVTVDRKTNDIFIGTTEGVLRYNKATEKAEMYGAEDTMIHKVFSKDNVVYFSDFGENLARSLVYKIVDGQVSRFEDLKDTTVTTFMIDNDDYIIFSNRTGFYHQKKGTRNAVAYAGPRKFIRGFSTNSQGDVYAGAVDGIYFVNKEKLTLDLVLALDGCKGIAFDAKNNILYADDTTIHRLQPSQNQNCA